MIVWQDFRYDSRSNLRYCPGICYLQVIDNLLIPNCVDMSLRYTIEEDLDFHRWNLYFSCGGRDAIKLTTFLECTEKEAKKVCEDHCNHILSKLSEKIKEIA